VDAMIYAIIAMTLMIVLVDQLLWRPIVVWAQKFRVEEGGQAEAMTSWFLDLLNRSRILRLFSFVRHRQKSVPTKPEGPTHDATFKPIPGLSTLPLIVLIALLAFGGWKLIALLKAVPLGTWGELITDAGFTLGRVALATGIGTIWALPAGLAIGLSPKLS